MGRHELGSCSRPFETSLATPGGSLDAVVQRGVPEGFWASMGVQMGLET